MNLTDLINAYQQWGQGNREMMGNVPGLLPLLDATSAVAETPGVGMAIPAAGGMRLGDMLSRYRILQESPLWKDMPRLNKLMMLRGAEHKPPTQLINELKKGIAYGKSNVRLSELLGKEAHKAGSAAAPLESSGGFVRELLSGGRIP